MERRTGTALAVGALVVIAGGASAFGLFGVSYASQVRMGLNYLDVNYNPHLGLIPVTPGNQTYFVYSDNFLAAYVLSHSGNATLRAIAANITSTAERYLAKVHDPENQYEVIDSTNGTFYASSNYVLGHVGSAVVEATFNNGTGTLSPASYADAAFLESVYFHQASAPVDARAQFDDGAKLYNGVGLKDLPYNDTCQSSMGCQYQTYKLALYDYSSKLIGVSVPSQVEPDIVRMQDTTSGPAKGGFYTGYTSSFSPDGTSTNVETTSLAVLALSTPGRGALPQWEVLALFGALVAAVAVAELVLVRRPGSSKGRQKPKSR
jgi:hypothetical protein